MAYATRIDIEEELAAAERGECLLCRIGARHPDDSPCDQAKFWNDWWDSHDYPLRVDPREITLLGE